MRGGLGHTRARQDDPDFRELTGLRLDLDRAAMLLNDDVVTDRQAKPSTFARRLGGEERVEHLFLHILWDAGAIVADRYFNAVAEVPRLGHEGWLVIAAIGFCSAFGRCVESVGNQIEQNPGNVLREHVDLAGGRVQ